MLSDRSNEAADTGTLTHAAIEAWHKNGQNDAEAIEYMQSLQHKFPLGLPKEAEKNCWPYFNDPRNKEAKIILNEQRITFTLQEESTDQYGPIYVTGTLDQVREEHGLLYLWDIKTGKKQTGWEMVHYYATQQAAYVMGASQFLGKPVYPGGILRTYGYRVRDAMLPSPMGVFCHSPYDLKHCHMLLRIVASNVAMIRRGDAVPNPGEHCSYCFPDGVQDCLPAYENLFITV